MENQDTSLEEAAAVESSESLGPTATMSGPGEVNSQDILSKVGAAIESLDHFQKTYVPDNSDDPEMSSIMRHKAYRTLGMLKEIPAAKERSALRVTYDFFRGKLLCFFDDRLDEAENHLSRVVWRNQSLTDAWLSLTDCLWKQGEHLAAIKVLDLVLEKCPLKQCPNQKTYCDLSILEKRMAEDLSFDRVRLIEQSIEHAKKAVACEVKDGYCWCKTYSAIV